MNCFESPDFCYAPPGLEPCPGGMYFFGGSCWSRCPAGTAPTLMLVDTSGDGVPDKERAVCIGCTEPGCELCDPQSPELCKICESPLLNHEDKCYSSCPSKWKSDPEGNSCVEWTYNDLQMIPFPFLTLAFILCMIACCGKCKKKTIRGKRVSTQNTITCFLVVIAFVQFLAVIGLIVWALLFESKLLFIVVCGILLLLLFLNVIF